MSQLPTNPDSDGTGFIISRVDIKDAKLPIKWSPGYCVIYNDIIFKGIAEDGIASIW